MDESSRCSTLERKCGLGSDVQSSGELHLRGQRSSAILRLVVLNVRNLAINTWNLEVGISPMSRSFRQNGGNSSMKLAYAAVRHGECDQVNQPERNSATTWATTSSNTKCPKWVFRNVAEGISPLRNEFRQWGWNSGGNAAYASTPARYREQEFVTAGATRQLLLAPPLSPLEKLFEGLICGFSLSFLALRI